MDYLYIVKLNSYSFMGVKMKKLFNRLLKLFIYLIIGFIFIISPVNIATLFAFVLFGMFTGYSVSKIFV